MSISTILEQILAHKKIEVATAKARVSLSELESSFPEFTQPLAFSSAMRSRIEKREVAVIAEIKKASPSEGLIREDFEPSVHARDYQENGATCLSILTDEKFFQGRNEYLQQAKAASTLPVIRKDFMIDPYQIAESKALGADCILLIVAALQPSQLSELASYASDISIDIVVEVHNQTELESALDLGADMIGINNRNLHTFETNLQTTLDLAIEIPSDKLIITESGIHSREDVNRMLENGIYGFLVGEAFMRAQRPGEKLRELMFGDC